MTTQKLFNQPPTKTRLTFARAFDVITHNQNTSAAEKLVLIEVCRYYPEVYWDTNETIAHNTGLTERYVQRILKALSTGPAKRSSQGKARRRSYLFRGYSHEYCQGRPRSVRVIKPLFLPGIRRPKAQQVS